MSERIVVENNYQPNSQSAIRFHSSSARVIVCVGGMGSGKSTAVVKEIELSACQWKSMPIGLYRKTMPALRDSTLHEFREMSDSSLGDWRAREDKYLYKNGSFVNFRGLDDPNKAKSTEYAMIVMEEAEEFSFEDFRRLNERVRKKGDWPLRIILVLNPVDEDHWIYKEFVENKDHWEAQGGLDVIHWSTRDNMANLPDGYIEQVSVGMSEEEIARYIDGQWGTIVRGEAVYKKIINPDIHLRKVDLYPGQLLLRGWDFGFNHPAVSFRVVDELGRMNCKYAIMGDKIHLEDFIPTVLTATTKLFGVDLVIKDFGDPRGHDNSPNGKETCFDILKDFGVNAIGERGSRNYVEEGIKQVKKELGTLIQGVPKLTIDPNCSLLRAGFFGRYVRGDDGKPKKDGYYEHVMDADRYISHHYRNNDAIADAMNKIRKEKMQRRFLANRYTGYSRKAL
jgi:PBSX family phage terminase large subunit